MIFVSVGTMLPFDRLIKAMDEWAGRNPKEEVFAQISAATYLPQHMSWVRELTPAEFVAKVEDCSVLVAHAGIGSIVTAAEVGRPIVLLPRQRALHEHRSDHQLHTVARLASREGILVAASEADLEERIAEARKVAPSAVLLSRNAPEPLVSLLQGKLKGWLGH